MGSRWSCQLPYLHHDGGKSMGNEVMLTMRCRYAGVMEEVENQFFRTDEEEKEQWNHYIFSSRCISLVDIVPSASAQGFDESSRNFRYYITVTSLCSLSLSLSPLSRAHEGACALAKREKRRKRHRRTVMTLIYLTYTNIQSILPWHSWSIKSITIIRKNK